MDTSLHYTSVNHANCLVSMINKLRHGGQLCDVIISAGNIRIAAHRLVLAASSPYFGPLVELNRHIPISGVPVEICLNDMDPSSMEQIIEFCYTSSICVSEENVWSLLPTATRLQMAELCTLCSDFLRSNLTPDTYMQTYAVAQRCGLTDLVTEIQRVLKDNLDKVFDSESYLEMNIVDMSEALQALPSSVLGHRDTLRAIRNWVQHKADARKQYASQLAHLFPGLLSRLKEFLPEELLLQPPDNNSVPSSPSDFLMQSSPLPLDFRTRHDKYTECDPDMNGLDLSMSSSVSRSGDAASDSVASPGSQDSRNCSTPSAPLCLVCGEIFQTQTDLDRHKNDCTEKLFRESGEVLESFPNSPAESTDSRDEEGGALGQRQQTMCPLCYKMFGDRKSLSKHMRTHSQSGFSCSVCGRRYSTRSHLLGHMRLHSGSQAPFSCEYCRHPFSSYCALKVHMRGHKGARPFSCPTCGQHFAKNIHLKRHITTHSGIKPHACDMCGKHFSRSDHLKRHVQSIHAGQRPHACHICRKAFVRKYELSKHLQLHIRTDPGLLAMAAAAAAAAGLEGWEAGNPPLFYGGGVHSPPPASFRKGAATPPSVTDIPRGGSPTDS